MKDKRMPVMQMDICCPARFKSGQLETIGYVNNNGNVFHYGVLRLTFYINLV